MTIAEERAAVTAEATSWIGTPFHHAARVKGAGVDCAQLLIGVYAGLQLVDEPAVGFYPADWFCHRGDDVFTAWLERACVPVTTPAIADIALFQFGRVPSHGAIVVELEPLQILHAFRGRGVTRDALHAGSPFLSRLAGFWRLRRWEA